MLSRFSHVQLFEALWTVDHQAPLSMSVGFSRQEYCSGLSYPPPGESSQSRDQTQVSCLAGGFFTPEPPREAQNFVSLHGVTGRHDWGTELDWTHSIYLFLHSYASKNHLSCDQLVTIIIVFLKNRVWLLYNVVLASAVQWSESALKVKVAQSRPTLCDPMDCSLPGSSVHGILLARILEWVAITFSRESSQPRDQTQVSCIADGFFTSKPPGKPKIK